MKNIFSARVYREGLRQTKIVGCVMTALSLLFASFSPILKWEAYKDNISNTFRYVSAYNYLTYYRYFMLIIPFVIILKLFNFLFKRGSSDFYHALPFTRQCLYISNLLVALTWYVITNAAAVLSTTLVYTLDAHVKFEYIFALQNFIGMLVIMLYITGAITIAMSIVGRLMVSAELAVFIALLPRIIMLMSLVVISAQTYIVNMNYVKYFSLKYNLLIELILGYFFDENGYVQMYSYAPGILITLLVSIIFLAIGLLLFYYRKSEVAENAAPNLKAQVVIQCVFALFFFLLAAVLLIEDSGFGCLVCMIIGALVYVIYSLITTRSFKLMVKTLPGLLIVVVVAGIYVGMLEGISAGITNNTPSATSIKSVGVVNDNAYYIIYNEYQSYNELLVNDIRFKDSEISSIIAQAYSNTCKIIKEDGPNGVYQYLYNYESDKSCTDMTFTITYTGGKTVVRQLLVDSNQESQLEKAMLANNEYAEAYYALPDKVDIDTFSIEKNNDEIWESFKSEYANLTDEQKSYAIYGGGSLATSYNAWTTEYTTAYSEDEEEIEDYSTYSFDASGYYNGVQFTGTYYIDSRYMPKTAELYALYTYQESVTTVNKFYQSAKELSGYKNLSFETYDTLYGENGDFITEIYFYCEMNDGIIGYSDIYCNWSTGDGEDTEYRRGSVDINNDNLETDIDLLSKIFDTENVCDASKKTVSIYAYVYDYEISHYGDSVNMTVNYDKTAVQELIDLMNQNYEENSDSFNIE
jgi:ABC-2 type transport system permease protein